MVVPDWLARAAAAHPGRVALQTLDGSLSYAELEHRTARATATLRAAGVRPGDRVALALPAGEGFAVALHACLRLAAAAMPIDLRLADGERAAQAASARLVIDAPLELSSATAASGGHDLDAVALVVHTSGTSGDPKPVELTFGNLLWSAIGSAVALGLNPEERWLCPLPLSHVGGLSILVRSAIYGTTAVLHARFDADAVARALSEEGVTVVSLVPTMVGRLLDAGLRRPPALRHALVGGAGLDPALAGRARDAGLPVIETYGLTEAASQVATDGVPLFCTRVEIAADGEILVCGPTVARGAAGPDGVLRTGDLGALDERGRLTVTGRKADTIVTGGENVAPAEVEAVLLAHPAVAEAAVYGRPDPEWGEAVTATVVLRAGAAAGAQELRAHAARSLAGFKVPKAVELAPALPRTASGKLRRRELAGSASVARMDPERYRAAQRDQWARSAAGWARRREDFQRRALAVSRWLIDAIEPQPGQTVLELAAGPGDTGLLAAELLRPGGTLICSDMAEGMLDAARERAREMGIDSVEFRVLELEWLDLEAASVDAVLCRWGYMLAADPGAALRETRRVLRPGGRVALAAWDAPERNPWATAPTAELVQRGLAQPRDPTQPGMFAFSPVGRIEALLAEAGFTEVVVDAVDLEFAFSSLDEYWEATLDLSVPFADLVGGLDDDAREAVRAGLRERLAPYASDDGRLTLPGRTLVAAAGA